MASLESAGFVHIIIKGLSGSLVDGILMNRALDYLLLQFERPGGELWTVAVLVFDPVVDRLYIQSRDDLSSVDPAYADVLRPFLLELAAEVRERSGCGVLLDLETTLSNALRISERFQIEAGDPIAALEACSARHLMPMIEARYHGRASGTSK